MSEVAPATLRVHRLTPLPDAFWRGVRETPWRYDLFQLLRRIDAQGGERYPLGRAPLPKFEPLRIGQQPSMGFAPSTVAEVRQREENGLHEVSILSFGLFGPNGPLPVHMTEYARERIHHHQDHSLSAFADLFHHRLTLLFYRAWADAQPAVSLDRDDNRRFEGYLASLIGMGAACPDVERQPERACPLYSRRAPDPPRAGPGRAGENPAQLFQRAGQAGGQRPAVDAALNAGAGTAG